MKIKNINSKLKLILKILGVVIAILVLILIAILLLNDEPQEKEDPNEATEQNGEEEIEEKEEILDIPSMNINDAFSVLDILIEQYGEPNPQGLIDILRETPEFDEEGERIPPTFQTVTWRNIKYGYDLTFNFWTDGSLARKDTYYFTGHNRQGHTIDEIFELTNLEKDSPEFLFNIVDFGGAVFNVGITPAEIARTPEPITQEEIDELTREEVLEILERNARREYPDNPARAKLEYDNQLAAYEWVLSQENYPDIMQKARREWGHNYIMVKWQYERDVQAHERKL